MYGIGALQDGYVRLQRHGAGQREQSAAAGKASSWDAFSVRWQHIAGLRRYGRQGLRMELVPREAESDGESSGADEEERLEEAERRRARGLARAARDAGEAAAREEAAQAELGMEGAAGAEGAAEAALRLEEEGGEEEAGEAEGGAEGEEAGEAGAAAEGGGEGVTMRKGAAGRGRAGKLWWREAWMGQVATAAFAQAREDARPQPHSARARRAQDAAAQRGRERAAGLGTEVPRAATHGFSRFFACLCVLSGALFSARKELHPVPAIMNSVTLTSDSPRSFGKYLNRNYAFCNLPRSRTTWTKEAGGKTC